MGKKTDRDLAFRISNLLGAIKQALDDLMDTMFIIYQPKDVTAAIGETAVFTVTAMNVNSYQWESTAIDSEDWIKSSSPGNTTDTLSVFIRRELVYSYKLRCKLTDIDGNVIYTNDVYMHKPD